MPRNGSGVAQKLPGSTAAPNTTIQSTPYNATIDDLYALQNEQRPITAGGTGAGSASDAREALGLKIGTDVPAFATTATKVDTRRQRVVNGDGLQSQENGNTAGTTNGYYAWDQFATYRVTSAGVITSQRVAAVTPAGSPYRYRVTITTADASLAAGEYLTVSTNLEGSNVADFQYGGSSAKASVLRFGFKGPAGTYAAALHNSAANRSFVALFTISAGQANTDTVQTIAITGDTTGTWLTADGVIGITLDIVLAAGSTYQGMAGWQAGFLLGTSSVSNGMGTGSAVFELFDVGLKLDPDATGVYGQYEVGETDAKYQSLRYLEVLNYGWRWDNALTAGIPAHMTAFFFPKAKDPTVANITFSGSGWTLGGYILQRRSSFVLEVVPSASGTATRDLSNVVRINARLS